MGSRWHCRRASVEASVVPPKRPDTSAWTHNTVLTQDPRLYRRSSTRQPALPSDSLHLNTPFTAPLNTPAASDSTSPREFLRSSATPSVPTSGATGWRTAPGSTGAPRDRRRCTCNAYPGPPRPATSSGCRSSSGQTPTRRSRCSPRSPGHVIHHAESILTPLQ